jgi:putative membrane protein
VIAATISALNLGISEPATATTEAVQAVVAKMTADDVSKVTGALGTTLDAYVEEIKGANYTHVFVVVFLENLMGNLNGGSQVLSTVQQNLGGIDASQLAALKDGAAQVASGAASLADGLGTLDSGLGTLQQKAGELTSGVDQLASGASQLADGANTLVANNQALNDGVAELSDGTGAIVDGVGELSDGAHELADGIVTFSEDGIDKLLDSYTGDIEPLLDRIQAVKDAGESYETYTAIAKDVNGSVKFIYKTDAIKAE